MKVRRSGQGIRLLVASTALAVLAVAMPVNAQAFLYPTFPDVGSPAIIRGAEGQTRFMAFHVTLRDRVNQTLTYNWTTVAGSGATGATAPGDFTAVPGTLTFHPGKLSPEGGPIRIAIPGKTEPGPDKTFRVQVTEAVPTGATFSGTGTIINRDFRELSISPVATPIVEGTAAQALFKIERSGGYHSDITVDWRTVDRVGPTFAMPGFDYLPVSRATVTIPASEGDAEAFAAVSLTNNNTAIDRWADNDNYEHERELMVELIPGSAYRATLPTTLTGRRATANLVDLPRARIENSSAVEPAPDDDEDMKFTVRLSHDKHAGFTLNWRTQNGTATADTDFQGFTTNQPLEFGEGVQTQNIDVPLLRNADATSDRTFGVRLSNPDTTKVRIDRAVATGMIVDRDNPPTLTVADVSGFEDQSSLTFTLRLSRPTREGEDPAKVTVQTVNGTAVSGTQYDAVGPVVEEFGEGDTLDVTVDLFGLTDTPKDDRHFFLDVTGLQNVTLPANTLRARGTILNYSRPNVTITPPSAIKEGGKGERTTATFAVNLVDDVAGRTQTVEVPWHTEDGTVVVSGTGAAESAFAGRDYEAASGTLSFPPGTNSQEIRVTVLGNDRVDPVASGEQRRRFHVVLDRPRFGRFGDGDRFRHVANVVINDDDSVPTISIDDVEVVEGNSGTRFARFPVRLSQPTDANVLVDYRTFDGNAVSSGPAIDYTAIPRTTLTIPAGTTETTINVPVNGDTRREDNEWFGVLLIEAKNATIDTSVARGTIINDDGPYLTITDVTKLEGADGEMTPFQFTVRLHQAEPATTLSVPWTTRDGTAKVADTDDFGPDYQRRDGVLEFLPGGSTVKTITVNVIGDNHPERTEYFLVELTKPEPVNTNTAATLFKGVGVGTIINDDGPPMRIGDGSVARSTTQSVQVSLPVVVEHHDNRVRGNYAARYRTVDGTAKAGEHYVATEGTVTIDREQSILATTISVEVLPAASNDPERTFEVELFWPDYAELVTQTAKPKATVTLQAGATAPDPDDGGGGPGGPGGPGDPSDPGPPGPGDPEDLIARSFGEGRIETAVAVSADHWNRADAAVLATAWRFPDALAGASLAAGLDAPLLLTDKEAVPPVVFAELQRLGVQTVWILGGPSAVSFAVEDSLKDAGYQVVRLHGPDRFATAVEVANAVRLPPSGEVVLALGIHEQEHRAWPDALSAGALAASPDQIPTLLTRADEVPAITQQALDQLGARRVLLLGGPAAISPAVEQWLTTNGYEVVRLAGETRFGTSVAVASEALARWGTRALPVVFATGDNFPDGLAAGALAARVNGIVLLAPKDTLERAPEVRTFLEANRSQLTGGRIVGGPAAMSEDVQRQLAAAMGIS